MNIIDNILEKQDQHEKKLEEIKVGLNQHLVTGEDNAHRF